MEYKPFEPFKAFNPGDKVITVLSASLKGDGICEVLNLHEKYFFGANKPGWEWDIVYEVWNPEEKRKEYWTSRFLWTLQDHEKSMSWTSEDWEDWVNNIDSVDDYTRC